MQDFFHSCTEAEWCLLSCHGCFRWQEPQDKDQRLSLLQYLVVTKGEDVTNRQVPMKGAFEIIRNGVKTLCLCIIEESHATDWGDKQVSFIPYQMSLYEHDMYTNGKLHRHSYRASLHRNWSTLMNKTHRHSPLWTKIRSFWNWGFPQTDTLGYGTGRCGCMWFMACRHVRELILSLRRCFFGSKPWRCSMHVVDRWMMLLCIIYIHLLYPKSRFIYIFMYHLCKAHVLICIYIYLNVRTYRFFEV